jgi:hypothetical protein
MLATVDDDIDREMYNCEISEHIHERIRIETVLVKEKVKEMQKVIQELDKKIKSAKILETYAIHSKEEAVVEQEEMKERVDKVMEQHRMQKLHIN